MFYLCFILLSLHKVVAVVAGKAKVQKPYAQ